MWVLSEVPPHGCGWPWPRTAGGVAEWRWGKLSVLRVSARRSQLRPRSCRDGKDGAIGGGGGHEILLG